MKKIVLDDILLESAAPAAPAQGTGCGGGCGCGTSTSSCGSTAPSGAPKNFIALSSIASAPKALEAADIRAQLEGKKGPEFWRSLNELAQNPQFDDALRGEWKSAPASW